MMDIDEVAFAIVLLGGLAAVGVIVYVVLAG